MVRRQAIVDKYGDEIGITFEEERFWEEEEDEVDMEDRMVMRGLRQADDESHEKEDLVGFEPGDFP